MVAALPQPWVPRLQGALALAALGAVWGLSEDPALKHAALLLLQLAALGRYWLTGAGAPAAAASLGGFTLFSFPWVWEALGPGIDFRSDAAHLDALDALIFAQLMVVFADELARRARGTAPEQPRLFAPLLPLWVLALCALSPLWKGLAPYAPSFLQRPLGAAFTVALCLAFTGTHPRGRWIWAARGGLALAILWNLVHSASLAPGLELAELLALALLIRPSRSHGWVLATALAVLLPAQIVKYRYRTLTSTPVALDWTEKFWVLGGLVDNLLPEHSQSPEPTDPWGNPRPHWFTGGAPRPLAWHERVHPTLAYGSDGLLLGLRRLGDHTLPRVLERMPVETPPWNGASYRGLALLPVPRALWPEKPSWEIWNEFGHRFGVLRRGDADTSVGFNHLSEGYANFGPWGLWGAALAFALGVGLLTAFTPTGGPLPLPLYLLFIEIIAFPSDSYTLASRLLLALAVGAMAWAADKGNLIPSRPAVP